MSTGGWQLRHLVGEAGPLHEEPLPDRPGRQLWLCAVNRPALVLGSIRRQQQWVDEGLAQQWGVQVVRRRSGGAAVLVEPGAQLWADLLIGPEDPLWHDDVGRAAGWVGQWWQRGLAHLGVATSVHQGAMRTGPFSDRICFAGLGPGEVLSGGRKLVGLSQRRTRTVARFQTVALLRWEPARLAALCGLGVPREKLDPALLGAALGLTEALAQSGGAGPIDDALLGRLEAALVEELPR